MKAAYIDSSCLLAIAFDEPGAAGLATRLRGFDTLLSSHLLEAEVRSALTREKVGDGSALLSWVTWVYPNRPLTDEFDRIGSSSYLKGADLWHLACALFLSPGGKDLVFLTLDKRQKQAAAKLGFTL